MPIDARGRCCRIQVRVIDDIAVLDNMPWTSSSPIDGMFSPCGVCGQCTTQLYEYVSPKQAVVTGDAEPALVLRRRVMGKNALHKLGYEIEAGASNKNGKAAGTSLISLSSPSSGVGLGGTATSTLHKQRASRNPGKEDHVHGHVCVFKKSYHHHLGGGGSHGDTGPKYARGGQTHRNRNNRVNEIQDQRVHMRRRLSMVMRQSLNVLLAERRAGLDPGGSKSVPREAQNRHISKAVRLRLAATSKDALRQHCAMYVHLDIHARALLHPSSACHFLGRWHGDVAMRALTYSRQRFAEMREAGISFWPESLLMMIIEVYVLDKEPGVYLLHRGLSGSVAGLNSKDGDKGGSTRSVNAMNRCIEVHGGGKVFSLASDARGIRRESRHIRDIVLEQGWAEVEKHSAARLDGNSGSSAGSAIEDGEEDFDVEQIRQRNSGPDAGDSGGDDSDDDVGVGCTGPGSEGSCEIS